MEKKADLKPAKAVPLKNRNQLSAQGQQLAGTFWDAGKQGVINMIAEHSSEIIFVLDQEQKIEYGNASIQRILGHTPADLKGRKFFEVVHPSERLLIEDQMLEVWHHPGRTVHLDYRFATARGQWSCLRGVVRCARTNGGTGPDKTILLLKNGPVDQVPAGPAQPDQTSQLFRAMLRTNNNLHFALDRGDDGHFRFSFLNPKYDGISGLSEQDITGKRPVDLVPVVSAEAAGRFESRLQECLARNTTIEWDEFTSLQGRPVWWHIKLAPVEDDLGRISGVVGVASDITRFVEIEEEIQRQKESYDKKLSSQTKKLKIKDLELAKSLSIQEKLKESERFAYTVLNALTANIAILNEHGIIINVNRRWREFARDNGLKGDLLGENYLRVCDRARGADAGLAHRAARGIREIMRGVTSEFILTYPCHSPNKKRWFQMRVSAFNTKGPVRVVLAHEDITQQKLAEDRARERDKLFRNIFMHSKTGMALADRSGKFIMVNEAFASMLGYSEAELKGQDFYSISHPEDLDRTRGNLQKIISGEAEHLRYEKRYLHKSGRTIWVEITASSIRDEYGNFEYFVGQMQDISQRRRAEEERLKLAVLVEQASEAVILTDLAGNIEYVNNAFEKITGYGRQEVIGKNPRLLKSGKQNRHFYKNLWDTITRGETWTGEFINRRKDGSLYHEDCTISPVKGARGEVTNYAALKRDISAQKKLEEQFYRAQRMESLGTLAGGIAHDLNNILAPISMAVEMLAISDQENRFAKYSDTIQRSAKRGADLVKQILTFARGTEGERMLLQPKHILRDVSTIIRETFPKAIEFQANIPRELPGVEGDPTQIHQILMNLCVNARDAMPDGGSLLIDAGCVSLDEQQAAGFIDAHAGIYLHIRVQDSGTGIPDEIFDRIFDPFFTTKERGKGTGLGLSTVQAIVKNHGGFLSVESQAGKGTTFNVFLPAREGDTTKVAKPDLNRKYSGQGETILVIDDEYAVREITREVLEARDYRVITAVDGMDGIDRYSNSAKGRVDAVITDMIMPKMDGLQTIRRLRKLNPKLKILVASGYAEKDKLDELDSMGVDAILDKPFSGDQLLKELHTVLHGNGHNGNNGG